MPPQKKTRLGDLAAFGSSFYRRIPAQKTAVKYLKPENQPYNVLHRALEKAPKDAEKNAYVAHWFVRDLRVTDNSALGAASAKAAELGVPLVCFYALNWESVEAHCVSPFQLHFRMQSLQKLQKKLEELNVPLYVLQIESKSKLADEIAAAVTDIGASHLYANIEYEVDELRIFTRLLEILADKKIAFDPQHDLCLVQPDTLKLKGKNAPYSVFTPWYKAWVAHLKLQKDPFREVHTVQLPMHAAQKDMQASQVSLSTAIPAIPKQFALTEEQEKNYKKLYRAGEDGAQADLDAYLGSGALKQYKDVRNDMAADKLSHLSVHFSSGTLNARTVMRALIARKFVTKPDAGDAGAVEWVRQIAWREFYKDVLVHWPFICMFVPFHVEYDTIKWEYNSEHFRKWTEGQTGYPVVDAAMRQLNQTGYMPNRARMIVASFLLKHLLIDWRYGERYFQQTLVDCDFAANNGGWGFSSSVGVDPQPYFRVFNPWLQLERFDKDGDYIRRWVPELADIKKAKGVHNPYENGFGKDAEENGYPMPIVEHTMARERCLERYKDAR